MAEATDPDLLRHADGKPSTGDLLKRARQSKGLTIQQIAQTLHLDVWILEALESNRFKDIGAPVFVKGHLRKFAAEVGVPQDDVMESYYRAEDAPETPGLVTDTLTQSAGDSRSRAPIMILSGVLFVLIIIVAWLWFRGGGMFELGNDPQEDAASLSKDLLTEPAATQSARQDIGVNPIENQNQGAQLLAAEQLAAEQQAGEAQVAVEELPVSDGDGLAGNAVGQPAATTATPNEAAVADGEVRLSIDFANDSWVEIYDASNRRLFFDLGKAGTRRSVTGEPPLQVLLGNAEDARVRVNNETFVIPAGSRRGKTARFAVQ